MWNIYCLRYRGHGISAGFILRQPVLHFVGTASSRSSLMSERLDLLSHGSMKLSSSLLSPVFCTVYRVYIHALSIASTDMYARVIHLAGKWGRKQDIKVDTLFKS